jgi:plasmid stabilization system protein ParE
MDEIVWSSRAINDADLIFRYISLDSKYHAEKWLRKVSERTTILLTHPNLGRVVPERNDQSIREVIEGNYRIMYKISGTRIIIYRIIHSSRNFK